MGEGIPFDGIVVGLVTGVRFTRLEWANKGIYILISDGVLSIKKVDGIHPLFVSVGDIMADDWIEVEKGGEEKGENDLGAVGNGLV